MSANGKLNPYQQLVLRGIMAGKHNRDIAQETGCSEQSVKNSIVVIYHFFGINSARQLIPLKENVLKYLDGQNLANSK